MHLQAPLRLRALRCRSPPQTRCAETLILAPLRGIFFGRAERLWCFSAGALACQHMARAPDSSAISTPRAATKNTDSGDMVIDAGVQEEEHMQRWGKPLFAALERSWLARSLLVLVTLLAALAVDWLLAPNSYPVAATYGIALLVAAQLLTPKSVALTTAGAFGLSIGSNALQHAPGMAAASDNAGLLAIGILAFLLARQRQISEAARARLELQYSAARALAESPSLQVAGSRILAVIAQHLGWSRGALWYLETDRHVLTCVATWLAPEIQPDSFDEQTLSA